MIAAALLCLVASVYDGDTLTCADRTRVRIAGVNAREMHGNPCPGDRPCPAMAAPQAQRITSGMVLGKTLRCRAVGKSWDRVVADCTLPSGAGLSCALIAAGAAVRWDSYWRQYRMPPCRAAAR